MDVQFICVNVLAFFFLLQPCSVKAITTATINQHYVLKWQQGFVNSETKLASSNQIMGLPVSACMNCDQKEKSRTRALSAGPFGIGLKANTEEVAWGISNPAVQSGVNLVHFRQGQLVPCGSRDTERGAGANYKVSRKDF